MARLTSLSDGCVIHLKKINLMFKSVCVYRGKNIQEGKKNKVKVKKCISGIKIIWLPWFG